MIVLIVVVVLVAVLAGIAVAGFNRLQRGRQAVAEAWAQVDTQLQRRYDLVGGLNEVVAAAGRHERLALGEAAAARALPDRDRVERQVQGAGAQLVALAEGSPQLQADERFRRLHEQLVRTEDDIAASRRYYNGRVRQLNTTRQTFPWLILAGPMGVAAAQYFQVDLDESVVPDVR
ncbi:MAG: LemA family protein [Acidimicrobiales bacterium]|nr:LemA family protein [Acidimicrobiales bacterium]